MANFNIISQFLKDISFESPNVPELFFKQDNTPAKMEINIDMQVKAADNNLFMVDLIIKAHSKLDGETEAAQKSIFMIDCTYTGLVQLDENVKDEEAKKRALLIDVPTLLFPSVRALIVRLTADSGFPPFAMQPVDFEALSKQKQSAPANNK